MAHAAGISAEAELGRVGSGAEEPSEADRKKSMTDPEEARISWNNSGFSGSRYSQDWRKQDPDKHPHKDS